VYAIGAARRNTRPPRGAVLGGPIAGVGPVGMAAIATAGLVPTRRAAVEAALQVVDRQVAITGRRAAERLLDAVANPRQVGDRLIARAGGVAGSHLAVPGDIRHDRARVEGRAVARNRAAVVVRAAERIDLLLRGLPGQQLHQRILSRRRGR